MILPGKQFEFDNLFSDESQKFGSIKLFQIGELSCISGYVVPPHKQWCHEISYIVSGEGYFSTNDEIKLLKEGDIHISPAGSIHAIETVKDSDLRYSYIGFDFDEDLPGENLQQLYGFYTSVTSYFSSDRNELLLPIFRSLDELYNKTMFYHLMVETYLIQILVLVWRSFTTNPLPIYFPAVSVDSLGRSVYTVIKFIDRNIFEKIDLKMIAHEVGYNYSYISDVFKKKTGITIQKYINNRKIQEATELLKFGKLTIDQVAQKMNYANVQSFNKAFKRTVGYSPSEYLKRVREQI
jgi:AraC-like DNA-binding protein/mannose-6-phosphate isomerase-like protein (cupin superfamily)